MVLFLNLVRIVCVTMSLWLSLSSFPDAWRVYTSKGGNAALPVSFPSSRILSAMLVDSIVGLALAYRTKEIMSLSLRLLGLAVTLFYCTVSASRHGGSVFDLIKGPLSVSGAVLAGTALLPAKMRTSALGLSSLSASVFFALSPTLAAVRDPASVPVKLVSALALCAASWMVYGTLIREKWVFLPNIINLASSLGCLGMYARSAQKRRAD